ncbi:MAG: hypothetical protein EBT15_09080 [Betaproteobacteria bacterium]|nr:hypothetical protein [Betaproteobacteria bacterium]
MATPLLDKLNELLGRKKKPDTPAPTPEPTPPKQPGAVDYLKAWKLLRDIPIQKLGRVVSLSAVIVFFAISGLLAWLVVFIKFMLSFGR